MYGFQINTKVKWTWGEGQASGKVVSRYTEKVTETLKGTEITRDANEKSPAYLIEQEDGSQVLKAHSEVEKY